MDLREYVEKVLGGKRFEILGVLPSRDRQKSELATEIKTITSRKCQGIFVLRNYREGKIIELLPLPEDYNAVSEAFRKSGRKINFNLGQMELAERGNALVVGEVQQLARQSATEMFAYLTGEKKIELPTAIRRKYFDYEIPMWYVFFKYALAKKSRVLVPSAMAIRSKYKHFSGVDSMGNRSIGYTYGPARNKVLEALGLATTSSLSHPGENEKYDFKAYEVVTSKDEAKRIEKRTRKKRFSKKRRRKRPR